MKQEFKIYDGELNVSVEITEETKEKLVEKILSFCKSNDCISGEKLQQSDSCLIEAPNLLSEIMDEVFEFKTEWITD